MENNTSIRKLFPLGIESAFMTDIHSSFNIFFISEGFSKNEEKVFWNICSDFLRKLKRVYPFNLLTTTPRVLKMFGFFSKTEVSGIGVINGNLNSDKLNFGSEYEINKTLKIEEKKLMEFLKVQKIKNFDSQVSLSDIQLFKKNNFDVTNSLIVIIANDPDDSKYFGSGTLSDDTHYIISSPKGHLEQIVINMFCKSIGLAEENEEFWKSNDHIEDKEEINFLHENIFLKKPSNNNFSIEEIKKWKMFLGKEKQKTPLPIHTLDETIKYVYSNEDIKITRKGNVGDHDIYCSSDLCLMNYNLQNDSLKVREKMIPLCRVCQETIYECFKSIILYHLK